MFIKGCQIFLIFHNNDIFKKFINNNNYLFAHSYMISHNTPQSTSRTATYLPSWKLSKLDEPDMQDTAGEAGTSS